MKCRICESVLKDSTNLLKVKSDDQSSVAALFVYALCNNCKSLVAIDGRLEPGRLEHYYNELETTYFARLNEQSRLSSMLNELLTERMVPDGHVWDVGCGDGSVLLQLNKKWVRKGIEPSESGVRSSVDKGFDVMKGTASTLKFRGVADSIICIDVLEHLVEPRVEVEAMYSMLKENAVAIFFTGYSDSLNRIVHGKNWYYLHCYGHVSVFSKQAISDLLRSVGFREVVITRFPHDSEISFYKWFKRTIRNIFKRPVPVPYFHDHMLIVARK